MRFVECAVDATHPGNVSSDSSFRSHRWRCLTVIHDMMDFDDRVCRIPAFVSLAASMRGSRPFTRAPTIAEVLDMLISEARHLLGTLAKFSGCAPKYERPYTRARCRFLVSCLLRSGCSSLLASLRIARIAASSCGERGSACSWAFLSNSVARLRRLRPLLLWSWCSPDL